MKQSGLGDKVDSWVGQGENHPIEPGQLGNAIGQTTLEQIAAHAGIDQQELLNQLSQVLPGLVDKLTANGQVPDANTLSSFSRAVDRNGHVASNRTACRCGFVFRVVR